MLTRLVGSRRVMTALSVFIFTAIQTAFPQIPETLVSAAQVFAGVLIGSFTLEDTARLLRAS